VDTIFWEIANQGAFNFVQYSGKNKFINRHQAVNSGFDSSISTNLQSPSYHAINVLAQKASANTHTESDPIFSFFTLQESE
jgi:hypothetical protein